MPPVFQRKLEKISLPLIGVLIIFNILAWIAVFDLSDNSLKVVFFDVGQGDSIFIETPLKHQILIDGGPSSEVLEKLGREMPFYDRSIDLVILTHPESDHLTGLLDVLRDYKVDYILYTGVRKDTQKDEEWESLLKEKNPKIIFARAGEEIDSGNVSLSILYPFDYLVGKEFKNVNDTSVVSLLKFHNLSFLFTGDIYEDAEKKIIDRNQFQADVLKVAHHGSKTSTSDIFLEKIKPKIAAISVGKNNHYGHPAKEVIERLRSHKIEIFRTDNKGDIKIKTDGFQIWTKCDNI